MVLQKQYNRGLVYARHGGPVGSAQKFSLTLVSLRTGGRAWWQRTFLGRPSVILGAVFVLPLGTVVGGWRGAAVGGSALLRRG